MTAALSSTRNPLSAGARLLLVSHSGRLCSAGSLLYYLGATLRAHACDVSVLFHREHPQENVQRLYSDAGIDILTEPDSAHYDLIVANTLASAVAVVTLVSTYPNTPIALWIHEAWPPKVPSLLEEALGAASAVIVQSEYQSHVVYKNFLRGRAITIYSVPNGVQHCVPLDSVALRRGCPRIVAVGAIQPRKRYIDLIRAVSHFEYPARCFIVGERKEVTEDFNQALESCPWRCEVTGQVHNSLARSFIESADVIAHPSECESQSIAILEAMRYAKPLVVADLPAYRFQHLVNEINCLMYPVGDYYTLHSCLDRLIRNPQYAESLGAAAYSTYQCHFQMNRFEQRIFAVISEIILASKRSI